MVCCGRAGMLTDEVVLIDAGGLVGYLNARLHGAARLPGLA